MRYCFHVHGGGGIVKDKDSRLYGNGTGKRNSLLLTARKSHASFTDDSIILLRQLLDEFIRIGKLGAFFYIIIFKVAVAESDVAVYSIGIQQNVLSCNSDISAEITELMELDVYSVDKHLSAVGIVKSRYKIDKRCFSAARFTHYSNRLAGRNMEADIIKHLFVVHAE